MCCGSSEVRALVRADAFAAYVYTCTSASEKESVRSYFLGGLPGFNPFTPKVAKTKNSPKQVQISFRKIRRNKWSYAKILPKRIHLNGNTIGFCQQIKKLE